jgi:hypothetical protein
MTHSLQVYDVTVQTFVVYTLPGGFVTEEHAVPIDSRDIAKAIAEAPKNAFCFRFYDVYSGAFVVDGEEVVMTSEPTRSSGQHFIDGRVLDESGLREEGLLSQYKPGEVVKHRLGRCTVFDGTKDLVVSS